MAQYSSRICIKVSSPEIWKRFEDKDDAGLCLAEQADLHRTKVVIDEDSWREKELDSMVKTLAATLGTEGIVIADTTNINVDPYDYCVYYMGDGVKKERFGMYGEKSKMFFKTNIHDITGWLSYGEFEVSEGEKDQLSRCGYICIGDTLMEFASKNFVLDKVYLRETSYEGRADRIEHCVPGEELCLVHSPSEYDETRLEVMGKSGSLGYLPSEVSDEIAVFLLNHRLQYSAKITKLVKASERNRHARSAVVGIQIEAKISKDEVE